VKNFTNIVNSANSASSNPDPKLTDLKKVIENFWKDLFDGDFPS